MTKRTITEAQLLDLARGIVERWEGIPATLERMRVDHGFTAAAVEGMGAMLRSMGGGEELYRRSLEFIAGYTDAELAEVAATGGREVEVP